MNRSRTRPNERQEGLRVLPGMINRQPQEAGRRKFSMPALNSKEGDLRAHLATNCRTGIQPHNERGRGFRCQPGEPPPQPPAPFTRTCPTAGPLARWTPPGVLGPAGCSTRAHLSRRSSQRLREGCARHRAGEQKLAKRPLEITYARFSKARPLGSRTQEDFSSRRPALLSTSGGRRKKAVAGHTSGAGDEDVTRLRTQPGRRPGRSARLNEQTTRQIAQPRRRRELPASVPARTPGGGTTASSSKRVSGSVVVAMSRAFQRRTNCGARPFSLSTGVQPVESMRCGLGRTSTRCVMPAITMHRQRLSRSLPGGLA